MGHCWLTGLPDITTDLPDAGGAAAQVPGLAALVVLPVLQAARFVSAVALYF